MQSRNYNEEKIKDMSRVNIVTPEEEKEEEEIEEAREEEEMEEASQEEEIEEAREEEEIEEAREEEEIETGDQEVHEEEENEEDARRREEFKVSFLHRRPSIHLPSLEDKQQRFFSLVSDGKIQKVGWFLDHNPDFNINCVSFQGISALHVAIEKRNLHMISFLLRKNIEVGDCALHSIYESLFDITKMILDKLRSISPTKEFEGVKGSAEFTDGMTPLILAAQCNNFEMIRMLISRGHSIPEPHLPSCRCAETCRELMQSRDKISLALQRVEVCRGIISPAYICQTSDDPILKAFELCKFLNVCSTAYVEFRSEYIMLARKCREFVVEILDKCKSAEEVTVILKQKTGHDLETDFPFPRLILAMDYYQKEFVAHPYTQHVIEHAWSRDWFEWHKKPTILQSLTVIERIFLQPVIVFMCLLMPKYEHWRIPVNRMLNNVASYIIFLTLIFIQSNLAKNKPSRGAPRTGLEIVLVVYVLSHMWGTARLLMVQGFKHVVIMLQNWYDFITDMLFITVFAFWLIAYMREGDEEYLSLERKFWHYTEPILIAEGVYAIASIMAFGRLLLLCQLNYYLGPLQVSIGKMTKDIAKMIIISSLLVLSFSAGLSRYYHYYDGMVHVDEITGIKTQQQHSFVNFRSTLHTLFWGLFNMAPSESSDVVIENIPGVGNNTSLTPQHTFTQTIGSLCFAVYNILATTVILNMLIASMSNTFHKVRENVDVEWKFGRTAIYLSYMAYDSIPPPFNFLPSAKKYKNFFEWYEQRSHPAQGKQAKWSFLKCFHVKTMEDPEDRLIFSNLMSQLIQRYFMKTENTRELGETEEEMTHL